MPIRDSIAVFSSVAELLAATLPANTRWAICDTTGYVSAGYVDSSGSVVGHPLRSGQYIPFADMADGNYGYSIDSGGTLITEDSNGLLVEMTASTSWEITLTGLAPTTGAYSWVQSVHLWCTVSAPTGTPNDGDLVYIRSVTDASNHGQAALRYVDDGTAAWEINAARLAASVETEAGADIDAVLAGTRVFGLQMYAFPAANQTKRGLQAEYYTDTANGATHYGSGVLLTGAEDISAFATTQTIKIGGAIGAGTAWTVRLHGVAVSEIPIVAPGVPF